MSAPVPAAADWAERIRCAWQSSLDGIMQAGRLLAAAKLELPHGQFQQMVDRDLPFSASTARRLMIIARDQRLTERAHAHVLPPHWATLYELTKLDDDAFEQQLSQGVIRPDMERAEVEPTRTAVKRGIGTRSAPADERGLDFYPTPIEAVRALLAIEAFAPTVWEPACGNGAVSRPLEDAGYDVRLTDIADRGLADRHGECQEVADFLISTPDGVARDIVTNPPFGLVNAFIAHALRAHRPRKMAMLLNLNAMCGADNADRIFWMEEWPPARILVFSRRLPMMHRDGWDGERAGSQMNTAWFIWEATGLQEYPYGRETRLVRVDWKKLVDAPALPPVPPPRRNEIADALIEAEAAKAVARRAGRRIPQQEHTS